MDSVGNTVAIRFLTYSTVACILGVSIYSWLKPKPLPYLPHNPVTGLLGDIPEIAQTIKSGKTIIDYFGVLVDRHGPIVQVCIGGQVILLVAGKAEIEQLVTGKNMDLSLSINRIFFPIMPTSQISLPTNNIWKHHRRVLGPSMHRRYLSRMAVHVSNAANSLVELWGRKANLAQDSSFGADADLRLATIRLKPKPAQANISLGSSLGCIDQAIKSISSGPASTCNVADIITGDPTPTYRAIRTVLSYATRAATLPFGSLTIPIYMRFSPSFRRARYSLHTFMLTKIAAARQREDNNVKSGELITDADCILDMLIQQEVREGSEALSPNELLDELMTVFIAGQETTSSALAWFVKFVAKDPEIQRRLHEEMCTVFGTGDENSSPTTLSVLSDAESVPILEAVATETLRCALVAAAVSRQLLNDDTIIGRHVPKGTTILLLTGLMGIQESDWGPDARVWRPSRWLREDGSFNRHAGPDGSPFGLGHRSCFGQKLAVMQLKIFIATLSRAFFFKPVAPEVDSWEAVSVITTQPKQCYIRIERWD